MGIIVPDTSGFRHPVSVTFDGVSDCLRNTTNNTLGIANSWTLSIWVKFIDSGAGGLFFEAKSGANSNDRIDLQCTAVTGDLNVILRNSAGTVFKNYTYTGFLGSGAWINCLLTWDGATLTLYKNGVSVSPDTLTTNNAGTMSTTTRQISFGADIAGNSAAQCRLHSSAMWNAILTQAEITLVGGGYDGARIDCRAVQPASLQHWWIFGTSGSIGIDRGFGTTNIDVATNALTVTESRSVMMDCPVNNMRQFNFPGHAFCLDFDGSAECINMTGAYPLNIGNVWTFMAWIKPMETSFPNTRSVWYFGGANTANAINFDHSGAAANDPLTFRTYNSAAGAIKSYTWNNLINATQSWQQIIVTWDGTTLTLYSNGAAVVPTAKGVDLAGTMANVSRGISVAASATPNQFWLGRLHSGALWNIVLSSSQASALYNSGNARTFDIRTVAPPVHWWLFGTQELVTDYIDSNTNPIDLSLLPISVTKADDIVADFPGV